MQYEWINNVAKMSTDYTTIHFCGIFNEKIEPKILPENLTSPTFGYYFNQKIEANTLPDNIISLTFGCDFNQGIDSKMLPFNLKTINFNWLIFDENKSIKNYIEMVNNIPSYYQVIILLYKNIFGNDEPKWPIHVTEYMEHLWPSKIYEIQDKYMHQYRGSIVVLINKKSYQPYSSAKSALK